jgi:hypothetical protein
MKSLLFGTVTVWQLVKLKSNTVSHIIHTTAKATTFH